MTAEQFTYWLQGFSELNAGPPDEAQWQSIREHLATVFKKVTPPLDLSKLPPAVPYTVPADWLRPLRAECTSAGDPNAGKAQTTC